MAKPVATGHGKKVFVRLKASELPVAAYLDIPVEQHDTLGDVISCENWKQAEELAGQIRRTSVPIG